MGQLADEVVFGEAVVVMPVDDDRAVRPAEAVPEAVGAEDAEDEQDQQAENEPVPRPGEGKILAARRAPDDPDDEDDAQGRDPEEDEGKKMQEAGDPVDLVVAVKPRMRASVTDSRRETRSLDSQTRDWPGR